MPSKTMNEILNSAIQSVQQSKAAWCRFITGNDAGTTGSHQAGFYVPKCASSLLFDEPGQKGENKEKTVHIRWQNDFVTESCMKYYGQKTRNEYRITRFGRNFPFLQDENVGDLLIIAKFSEEDYAGYVLSSDEDIDEFLAYFNLSPDETNQLIDAAGVAQPDERILQFFKEFTARFKELPETKIMAAGARECYNRAYNIPDSSLTTHPDGILQGWIDTEFCLFRHMEEKFYGSLVSRPFASVADFVQVANMVLNRRKSRAGKSLEHHLADIFSHNGLFFEEQAVTEDNKKPDFLFPNGKCYHNILFPVGDLTILGVKTSCKDRWRQVLTEADRVQEKFLFTMQPGISRNQLKEMQDSHLTLVVPNHHIASFPAEWQSSIQNLAGFIRIVREKQERMPKHFLWA